ncbi:hypothetical protein HG531_009824 [Fusarium graminearum]|nr:hypothetical protein HG531_009824 [Fusarium graminearum]
MRRASEMEHARLLTLLYMVTLLDCNFTGAHLIHTDTDKSQQSNSRLISLDNDDSSCSQRTQETLTLRQTGRRNLCGSGLSNTLEERFTKVRAVLNKSAHDLSRDRSVPAVVRQSGEESLVDGSASKLLSQRVMGEHIEDGVGLALCEKAIAELDVVLNVVHAGLTAVGDNKIVVRRRNGTSIVAYLAGEKV